MDATADERGYLDLLSRIADRPTWSSDGRTGVRTKSIFGAQLRFSLADGTLPLLTTKHVSFDNVAKELLWFISGSTDQRVLEEQGVNIWRANDSPEVLRRLGLEKYKPFRDTGPIYGHQWRHFGAKYVDSRTDYTNMGYDQLARVLYQLRAERDSRRIILTAWNPAQIHEMCLAPCHCMAQFRLINDNELSTLVFQRSADMALGVPYNIASYALLTHILAHMSDSKPHELIMTLGDAHVYEPHLINVAKQVERMPFRPPKLRILRPFRRFDEITVDSFNVIDYFYHSRLKYEMVV